MYTRKLLVERKEKEGIFWAEGGSSETSGIPGLSKFKEKTLLMESVCVMFLVNLVGREGVVGC